MPWFFARSCAAYRSNALLRVRLDKLEILLNLILISQRKLEAMPLDLAKLTAAEQAVQAQFAALRQLIKDLTARIEDPADQAAVDALADKLTTDAQPPTT